MLSQTIVAGMLGAAVLGAPPDLPEGVMRLAADVRDRATVVVSGTFTVGRGPCQWLPDGSRRWPILKGFRTGTVYRGQVRTRYMGLEAPWPAASSDTSETNLALVEGREYVLLLRPSLRGLNMLRRRSVSHSQDALAAEDIVAIVEP